MAQIGLEYVKTLWIPYDGVFNFLHFKIGKNKGESFKVDILSRNRKIFFNLQNE